MELDILKKLAGLLNSTPVSAPVAPQQPANDSCGCGSSREDMRKFIDVATFEEELSEEEVDEWANSSEHFDGEPRKMEQPHGEVVDTSLRRYLKAKGQPVKVEENDASLEKELEEAYIEEGIKDKLKIMALLGLTGLGANYALNTTSAVNSPLGQALANAAAEGDTEAQNYLRQLDAIIDGGDTQTLKMLNFKYIDEPSHTSESMMESYRKFKGVITESNHEEEKEEEKEEVKEDETLDEISEDASFDLEKIKKNAGLI